MNNPRIQERVEAGQASIVSPGHRAVVVTSVEPVLPDPVHTSLECREATAIPRDSIVRAMASQFEPELSVLVLDGVVQVLPAPLSGRM
jgi:hypothetical protein